MCLFQWGEVLSVVLKCPGFHSIRVQIREVSQIGNVHVSVNINVEFHPVGCSTPHILLFLSVVLN